MPNVVFHESEPFTLGTELELQIINPDNQHLTSKAKDLIRTVHNSKFSELIKPEITQCMIELNSSIHTNVQSLTDELFDLAGYVAKLGKNLDIEFCGGGTHPFDRWDMHKIFPLKRFKTLSRHYGYLAKQCTVFAFQTHIGCANGNDAIYLTHMMARYLPHLITLSASSPFSQGADTGFDSSRLNTVYSFPYSGYMPYFNNWREFSTYFLKMRQLKIIKSMKDFYWDIRPKPMFGTIEIRVCDMPLTIERTSLIVAYIQAIARYLIKERPHAITPKLSLVHDYNRFQACRYGFMGHIIDPFSLQHHSIFDDILTTLKIVKPHAEILNSVSYLKKIESLVQHKENDASLQKQVFSKTDNLNEVVKMQCDLWSKQF